jgi:hypothetical protein
MAQGSHQSHDASTIMPAAELEYTSRKSSQRWAEIPFRDMRRVPIGGT